MEILLLLISCISNIVCLVIGTKVGQTVSKGESIELLSVNPFEAHRKAEARKEAQMEQDRIDTILRNVDNYDGTGRGQEEVG